MINAQATEAVFQHQGALIVQSNVDSSSPISSLDMYLVDIYCSPVTPWQWLMHCLTWHLVAQDTGLEGRICKGRRGNEANHNKGEIVDFSFVCLFCL